MIRAMWQAASAPGRFFADLEAREFEVKHILPAALAGVGAYLFAALWVGLAVARATQSELIVVLAAAAVVGVVQGTSLWAFCGLIVQWLGKLDLRAYELSGWSWTPAAFAALSLALPLVVFPLLAILLLVLGSVSWHFAALRQGLIAFRSQRVGVILLVYFAAMYAFPLGLAGLLVAALGG
jgi:hypothetical protein